MTTGAVTLRTMTLRDVERVMPLEHELFDPEAWSPALFYSELDEQPATRHYVVAEDETGEVVGYAGLCAYDDEAYVQTIGVRRDRWGQGLGARLLEHLLDDAARRGNDHVLLEVRADNERAQALYRRYGFEPIGLRRGYYQPSGTDAVVMKLSGVRARAAGA